MRTFLQRVKLLFALSVVLGALSNQLLAFTISATLPSLPNRLPQMTRDPVTNEFKASRVPIFLSGTSSSVPSLTGTYTWEVYDLSNPTYVYNTVTTTSNVLGSIDMVAQMGNCQIYYAYTVGVRVVAPNSLTYTFSSPSGGLQFNYFSAGSAVTFSTLPVPPNVNQFIQYVCGAANIQAMMAQLPCMSMPLSSTYNWESYTGGSFSGSLSTANIYTPTSLGKYQGVVSTYEPLSGITFQEGVIHDIQIAPDPVIDLGCSGCTSGVYSPGMTIQLSTTSSSIYMVAPNYMINSYQWYRNGQLIPGANSLSYNPGGPGRYHLVANNVCDGQFISNIVEINSDICDNNYLKNNKYTTIGNTGGVTMLSPGLYTGNLFLKGEIELGGGIYDFSSANLIFEACSYLHVINTADVTFNSSDLRSCSQWGGIKVEAGCSLTFHSSNLSNAYVGILLNGNAYLNVDNTSNFEQNHLSISIDKKNNPGIFAQVNSSNFENMDRLPGLSCNVANMGNYDGTYAYIYVEGSEFIQFTDNKFRGWEITLYQTQPDIDPIDGALDFYGIQCLNSQSLILESNTFFNGFKAGIAGSVVTTIRISGSLFTHTPLGTDKFGRSIWILANSSQVSIYNNQFRNQYGACLISDKSNSNYCTLYDNFFTDCMYGIELENTMIAEIRTNHFIGSTNGIRANNSNRIWIHHNTMQDMMKGISLKETAPFALDANSFTSTLPNAIGIESYREFFTDMSELCKIGNNVFIETDFGVIVAPIRNPIGFSGFNNILATGSYSQAYGITCNHFENNKYAISGSGPLIDQSTLSGGNQYAGNHFSGSQEWDLIWENAGVGGSAFSYFSNGAANFEPNQAPPAMSNTLMNGVNINLATYTAYFSNVVNPSLSQVDCYWEPVFIDETGASIIQSPSGISTSQAQVSFQVYPTLVEAGITISNSLEQEQEITILSIGGQTILQTRNQSGANIDLSHFSAGMYLVKVSLNDGSSYTTRIIRQ